ncbi:MAG: 5-formyltetrahydrofolate cyclo-ligase [Fusobacterium sp.]|nr:5-formyltetrahydrofolate cyclo-ligase [Fusobacterium sp.]
MNKKDIRKIIREKRENLEQDFINFASDKIFEKLKNNTNFLNAKSILSYMDFKNEVKTDKINILIKQLGKKLILPRVVDKDNMIPVKDEGKFDISSFGNREPLGEEYKDNIDLIIVPGVAFDKFGNRIGFGRGYYDRFFERYPVAKKIAIAFEAQVLDEKIETDIFDKKVDIIITEENYYKFDKNEEK